MKNRSQLLFGFIDIFATPLQNMQRHKGIECVKDIAHNAEDERLKLDIYFRTEDKDKLKPVVIFFAGGGFVGGSKNFRKSTIKFFASQGYAAIGANHRLAPAVSFPTPVIDCYKAVQFISEIAEQYKLDTSRVIIAGDSSGGYYASFVTALMLNPALRQRIGVAEPNFKPFGFMGFCGVYDVFRMFSAKVPFGLARVTGDSFLGFKLKKDFSNYNEYEYADCISSVQYIDENWVPTFMNYSKRDFFCSKQGEILQAALDKSGVPYICTYVKNLIENHDYQLFAFNPHSKTAFRAAAKYLTAMKERGSLSEEVTPAIEEPIAAASKE